MAESKCEIGIVKLKFIIFFLIGLRIRKKNIDYCLMKNCITTSTIFFRISLTISGKIFVSTRNLLYIIIKFSTKFHCNRRNCRNDIKRCFAHKLCEKRAS